MLPGRTLLILCRCCCRASPACGVPAPGRQTCLRAFKAQMVIHIRCQVCIHTLADATAHAKATAAACIQAAQAGAAPSQLQLTETCPATCRQAAQTGAAPSGPAPRSQHQDTGRAGLPTGEYCASAHLGGFQALSACSGRHDGVMPVLEMHCDAPCLTI